MNATKQASETISRKAILSTLWIFVVLNYLYGDLAMMIFHADAYQRVVSGMSEVLVLGATVLMEVFIAMVLLSRVLKYRENRWANIVVGVVGTVFVAATLVGKPPPFYIFLSAIEIASTLFIIWFAWTWRDPQAGSHTDEI